MGRTVIPVTMKTIATELGVSITTVSNAYSKPDRLSAELREQIFAKAEALGYCGPSAAGRALRSGRTDVCGFYLGSHLAFAFSDPYTVILLSGIGETLEEFGSSVLLLHASPDGESEVLQRAAVDAVVAAMPFEPHPGLGMLRRRGVPVVGTHRGSEGDWVAINDAKAGRLVGKHLARLGHSRIVVIVPGTLPAGREVLDVELAPGGAWPVGFPGVRVGYAAERVRGLQETLPGASIRLVCAGQNIKESGRRAGAHVLDDQHRPTAIVALSDVLAIGVWDAVRERGLTPGRDVSITGFDDLPDAGFLGLTTVSQPIAEKGRLAARLAMDPDYPDRQVLLPVELKVRASTGPAPLN